MGYRGLTKGEEAEALREELDIHSAITPTRIMRPGVGVDAFYDARHDNGVGVITPVLPSSYWVRVGNNTGYLRLNPATDYAVSLYSKRAYSYASALMRTILPNPLNTQDSWFGFEVGGGVGSGIAGFDNGRTGAGVEYLRLYVGGGFAFSGPIDLIAALPADAHTVLHNYAVKVNRSMVEFYIDNILIAVALCSPNFGLVPTASIAAYPPYAVFSTNIDPSRTMPLLIEGDGMMVGAYQWNLAPDLIRVTDSEPQPPRIYRLYDAGTVNLFAGLVIAAGSETSHPIPTFGYRNKTLFFQATTAGTLLIEVLTETGNWRVYDTITTVAAALESYSMDASAVLMRITFTPSTFPCTISDAELILGG